MRQVTDSRQLVQIREIQLDRTPSSGSATATSDPVFWLERSGGLALHEETQHLLAGVGAIGVGVTAAPTAAGPGVAGAAHSPMFGKDVARFAAMGVAGERAPGRFADLLCMRLRGGAGLQ